MDGQRGYFVIDEEKQSVSFIEREDGPYRMYAYPPSTSTDDNPSLSHFTNSSIPLDSLKEGENTMDADV